MFIHSILIYFSSALLLFRISQSQEIQGRVNLGSGLSSNAPESFIFTVNANSGSLPVFFDLYNVTNGSSVDGGFFDEDVAVSCVTTTVYTPGDSVITVANSTVPLRNGNTTGQVSFDIVSQGRRVEVQCIGETALTPSVTTSYFSLNTSAGQTGFVTIKKSPRVSLCSDRILVANSDGIKTGQVTVRLSEPVRDSNVTAKCEVVGVSAGDPTIWLTFDDVHINIGEDSAVMGYHIIGRGNTLQVNCSAESDDGVQYQTNSSGTGEILFDFESGSVQILPASSKVVSDRFTPLLVLSEPLQPGEADVLFFCALFPLNSTEEAQDIISEGECVSPDEAEGTTSVPGTTAGTTAAATQPDTTAPPATTQSITTAPSPTQTLLNTPAATTPSPTLPLQTGANPTAAPLANDTSIWDLSTSQILFEEGDIQQALEIHLSNPGNGYRGFLLVQCCATAELNTSPKYTGLSASALATVDVAVARAINWTEAAVSSELETEMTIGNPAYTEVSPCPCDLTANTCDANCCCDQLCSEEDNSTFTCLTGIQGGNFTKLDEFTCSNPDIYRPDWFPVLCVHTDNSPYLGLYFTARPGARDSAAYNTLKATSASQSLTSFEDSSRRALEFESPDANRGGYKYGFPVETLFDSNARGFLSLPQADPNGGCSWLSPIRFQMDTANRCTLDPEQSLCSESSVLSTRAFVISTNTGYPPCPEAPGILSSYGGSIPTPTTVRYYCREDITPYLVSGTNATQLFPPRGESLFPEGVGSDDSIPLPNRCAWDDGYSLPPVPEYEASTYLCSSAVLDIRYELFWRGNQLVQVDAVVVLGTVALSPLASLATPDKDKKPIFVSPPPTTAPTIPPSTPVPEVTTGATVENLVTLYENATGLTTLTNYSETSAPTQMPPSQATTQVESTQVPTTESQTTESQTTESQTTESQTTESQTTESQTTESQTTEDQTTAGSTMESPTTPWDVTTGSDVTGTASSMTTDDSGGGIILVPETPLEFTQHFRVKFTHLSSPLADPDPVQPPLVSEQETRSGKPGYVIGRRVLSGLAVLNPQVECNQTGYCTPLEPVQPDDVVQIDDSEANRLRVWLPGPGSLCAQSSLADVTFGEDHISGCILRLGWSLLSNCSTLRDMMLMELQSMVAADRIGKTGNASVTIPSDWAPVFNSEEHFLPTTTQAMTTDFMTTDFMTTDFMTTDNLTGQSPLDAMRGRCHDVPTGVNLEILYAHAGEFGGVIQREIVSAYVTFSKSTVKLQCIGAHSVACRLHDETSNETVDWVQSFLVTSTVVFTRVPAVSGENWHPFLCLYDMCNEEYIFPLTGRFTGDPRPIAMGMAAFVVLLTVAHFSITKPWNF